MLHFGCFFLFSFLKGFCGGGFWGGGVVIGVRYGSSVYFTGVRGVCVCVVLLCRCVVTLVWYI